MSDQPTTWWSDEVLDRQRWRDFVGPTLDRLIHAKERDRLPHAVLLVGPAGLGRELAAVEAAVLLVCAGVEVPWCDEPCAGRIREGVHPDVQAVLPTGAKATITISQIREVVKSVASRPYEGERRVWILDGVEAGHLGTDAANAFLKTLEEPPEHAVFILLANNPVAVLPTILSRCQQLVLPGTVAIASRSALNVEFPELADVSIGGHDVDGAVETIRAALEGGRVGESRGLLRLPYALADGIPPFAAVSAVAMQMAGEAGEQSEAEEMALLAADLLVVERRAHALNLNRRAQMVSCLMRWYREL